MIFQRATRLASCSGDLRGAQRAAELTQQLLAYSGKGKFIVEPIDLSSLVRDVSQLIGWLFQKCLPAAGSKRSSAAIEADSSQISKSS